MKRCVLPIALLVMTGCDNDNGPSPTGPGQGFFVTSAGSATGNLGGATFPAFHCCAWF
jgi:hypothetical protein